MKKLLGEGGHLYKNQEYEIIYQEFYYTIISEILIIDI